MLLPSVPGTPALPSDNSLIAHGQHLWSAKGEERLCRRPGPAVGIPVLKFICFNGNVDVGGLGQDAEEQDGERCCVPSCVLRFEVYVNPLSIPAHFFSLPCMFTLQQGPLGRADASCRVNQRDSAQQAHSLLEPGRWSASDRR